MVLWHYSPDYQSCDAKGAIDLLAIQSRAISTTIHQKKLHDLEIAQVLICQCAHRYSYLKDALDEPLDNDVLISGQTVFALQFVYALKQSEA